MIKEEIRSLIRNLLPKIDQDNKYHPRLIDAAIEKVLAEMYNEIWVVDPLSLQRFCKRYGGTTPIAVSYDANAQVYYSTHPAKFIPFMDRASGVRRVTTKVQGGLTFFPMDQREVELVHSGVNVKAVNNKIGYIVTPERVEYYDMTVAVSTVGVRMDLIVPFSVYAETDTVLIPEVRDGEGKGFVGRVLEVLGVIQPPDTVDDNTTTVTNKE